jgi:aldehyde dehydrogenase (NAD+)
MADLEVTLTAPNGLKIAFSTGLFIDNEFVMGSSGEKLTSIDPA